jgi:hypothetical protein
MEMQCVYCEVGTEFLEFISNKLILKWSKSNASNAVES